MANKIQVPGVAQSHGIDYGDYLYDPGVYRVKINNVSYRDHDSKPLSMCRVNTTMISGPKQENGDKPDNRRFQYVIFFLHEDHPSYSEEMNERAVGEFKALCDAAGVKPTKDDSVDLEKFAGAEVSMRLSQRIDKRSGKPQVQVNQIAASEDDIS